MMKLIECVPNFSEGRDEQKINKIVNHIGQVDQVTILDVDSGFDTNRTVVTLLGPPLAIAEAAYQGIKIASEIIDMTFHCGTHPRLGATDVCPFIPISGVSEEECIKISKKVAERVGKKLKIPTYLYEKSAKNSFRSKLPDIRKGEYEGLSKKLSNPKWKPDFGPSQMNKRSGATIIGCRDFLIAYNINLNTKDHRLATDIAFELREIGRSKRIPHPNSKNLLDGDIVRQKNGKPVKVPGLFKNIKAIGWYVDTYNRAQISINFNDYKTSTIHDVFDAACKLAEQRGIRVTGSELVGLVPKEALLMAGIHYLKKQNRSTGIPHKDIIECAIQSLGLNDVVPFILEEKIMEYAAGIKNLANENIFDTKFLDELSSNKPAPGGGSAAALAGSIGAALCSMVAALSHEKKDMISNRPLMEDFGLKAQNLKDHLALLVAKDTRAFNRIIEANRLPSNTKEDQAIRSKKINSAIKNATEVPLETAKNCLKVIELANALVPKINPSSVSDVGVALEAGLAGLRGASLNVMINLVDITNQSYSKKIKKEVSSLIQKGESIHKISIDNVTKIMKKG